MKKYRMKASNSILPANWCKVKLTHIGNNTTNYMITPAIFKRECAEYDVGTLPNELDRYIGDPHE